MLGSLVLLRCLLMAWPSLSDRTIHRWIIKWLIAFLHIFVKISLEMIAIDMSGQLRSFFVLLLSSFYHLQLFYVRQPGIWNSFASLDKGFRRSSLLSRHLPFISKKNYNKYVFHLTKFQLIDIDPLSSSSFEFINVVNNKIASKDKRYFNPSVDMNMFVIDCLNNRTRVACQITCRICENSRLKTWKYWKHPG